MTGDVANTQMDSPDGAGSPASGLTGTATGGSAGSATGTGTTGGDEVTGTETSSGSGAPVTGGTGIMAGDADGTETGASGISGTGKQGSAPSDGTGDTGNKVVGEESSSEGAVGRVQSGSSAEGEGAGAPSSESRAAGSKTVIYFDFASDRLNDAEIFKLRDLVGSGARSVVIEGYTCSIGGDDYNKMLSERRAAAVMQYLSGSLQGATFKSQGHGSDNPAASNDALEGRKKNRRVEITINN